MAIKTSYIKTTSTDKTSTFNGKVIVGQSSEKLSIIASESAISSYTTSLVTTGVISSMTISQTMTVASTTSGIEVAQFILTSNVKCGAYANAILGKIDFATTGYVHGLAGVICAELDMPGGSLPGGNGTYTLYEAEINCPTSYVGGVPIHVFTINAWGDNVAEFNTNGFLFDIEGVTANTGKLIEVGTGMSTVTGTIRCKLNGAAIYLPYYSAAG